MALLASRRNKYRQTARVGNGLEFWQLDLFADADLASEPDDSKSSLDIALFSATAL